MTLINKLQPELQKRGITKIGLVLNCEAEAAKTLVDLVDLPCDVSDGYGVILMIDPLGKAGKAFCVGSGFRPDDEGIQNAVKHFPDLSSDPENIKRPKLSALNPLVPEKMFEGT